MLFEKENFFFWNAFICHQILIFIFSFCTSYAALKLFRFFSRFIKKVKLLFGKLQNCCCCPFKNLFFEIVKFITFLKVQKLLMWNLASHLNLEVSGKEKRTKTKKFKSYVTFYNLLLHISSNTTQIRTCVTIFLTARGCRPIKYFK